jgi:hypothetical protein
MSFIKKDFNVINILCIICLLLKKCKKCKEIKKDVEIIMKDVKKIESQYKDEK